MKYLVMESLMVVLLGLSAPLAKAQELPPPIEDIGSAPAKDKEIKASDVLDDPSLLEDYTGTLDANDEENQDLKRQDELFGDSDDTDAEDEDLPEVSHLLSFEFTSLFQFSKQEQNTVGVGPPFLEIEYAVRFETPIMLDKRRRTVELETEYDVEHWGSLEQNEFFDCRLNIEIPQVPVKVTSKLNPPQIDDLEAEEDGTDKEDLPPSCAFMVKFNKTIKEDWFSFCTDISGATLNTQGEQEEYMVKALKAIEPDLSGLVIDSCELSEEQQIDLTIPQEIIDDLDLAVDIVLSGSGSIKIEPY